MAVGISGLSAGELSAGDVLVIGISVLCDLNEEDSKEPVLDLVSVNGPGGLG